jgi:hypothetical protein
LRYFKGAALSPANHRGRGIFVQSPVNQDGAAMPVNAAFNVLVLVPQSDVFVHKATSANSTGHVTDIDHPLSNNDPNAIVFITPNWNPGGVGGTYNNHNIGVYYEYSVNYETYICDGVEYPQIWANEVIIGPHIQPAGYFSNPAKLKNQP